MDDETQPSYVAILRCKNHPDLRWRCKWEAINAQGKYTGARRIFFHSGWPKEECGCSADELEVINTELFWVKPK